MHNRIAELYDRYNSTLRPLVSEIEGRNEYFEEPLLVNVASMFDHIALSDANPENSSYHINQAVSHLDLCISQSYQYLIKNLDEKMHDFEKRCNASDRNILDGGNFIGKYKSLKTQAKNSVRSGLEKGDIDALCDYESAYVSYSKIEKMIDRELPVQVMHNIRNNSRIWTIIGWGLSIVISVLMGKLAAVYGDTLIEMLKVWKNV